MKRLLTTLAALAMALAIAIPAGAITDGNLDNGDHPYVGIMVAADFDTGDAWRCTGTLMSDTVFMTAGHCTYGADIAWVWFDAYEADIRANGWPFSGTLTGTPYTHPEYDDAAFFLHDLGVVVLDSPVTMSQYGRLPSADSLDSLKKGPKATFTSVGYGLQMQNQNHFEADLDRRIAHPRLIQINTKGSTGDFAMILSNNSNTGGTCFGDSGGPNFLGASNVVAGVTSFGKNANCAGQGGVYRVDKADDLLFMSGFDITP